MTEKLAHRLSVYFERQGVISPDKRDLLEYGIFHLLSSVLHIILLAAAGLIFSVLLEIAAFCLFFCSIKRYIGGAHANKHWVCLWGFTGLALGAALLVRFLMGAGVPSWSAAPLSTVALCIVVLRAPVVHPNSPLHAKKKLLVFRRKAIVISCVQLAAICVFLLVGGYLYTRWYVNTIALCGSAGSFAASVSLLLPVKHTDEAGKGGAGNEK